jgi:ABC-type Na+ efflux pump permease subunit
MSPIVVVNVLAVLVHIIGYKIMVFLNKRRVSLVRDVPLVVIGLIVSLVVRILQGNACHVQLVLQVNPDMLALGPQQVTAVLPVLLVSIYHHVLLLLLALVSPVETVGTIQAHTGLVVQAPLLALVQRASFVVVEGM